MKNNQVVYDQDVARALDTIAAGVERSMMLLSESYSGEMTPAQKWAVEMLAGIAGELADEIDFYKGQALRASRGAA